MLQNEIAAGHAGCGERAREPCAAVCHLAECPHPAAPVPRQLDDRQAIGGRGLYDVD